MRWTDDELRNYGLQPSRPAGVNPLGVTNVASALRYALASRPGAEALVDRHGRYTFEALNREINAAAAFLTSLGVGAGDRVAASAGNDSEIVVAFFATQRIGAVWVGVNRRYAPVEKAFLLRDSGARVFLADAEGAAQARVFLADTDVRVVVEMPDGDADSAWRCGLDSCAGAADPVVEIDRFAPAAIAYTSGTTGFPKGAVHSQHNIVVAASASTLNKDGPSTRVGTHLPLTILNLMILGPVASAIMQCAHVCMDRGDFSGIADWVRRERITAISCAPTTAYDLLTNPAIKPDDIASIRFMSVGGATVPEGLPELYRKRFGTLPRVGYGLTEAPAGVASATDETPRAQGALGLPLEHLDVQVLDDGGTPVEATISGEICVRALQQGLWANVYGPALGYWKNPAATDSLLRGGWLHTGDVGFFDIHRHLHIQDRRSEVIIRGGSNIYPAEVERVLRLDERVADCAVVGKPDARLGEVVVGFIQPVAGSMSDPSFVPDMRALCSRNLAAYKVPVEFRILEELPRNAMNKVIKAMLRELLSASD